MLEQTFELPIGYTDQDEITHKTVVMRPIRNIDIIEIQRDITLKQLAGELIDTTSANPVMEQFANAALMQLYSVILPRVVLRIGTVEAPNRSIFHQLFQRDMIAIMKHYNEMNNEVIPGAKKETPSLSPLAGQN